MKTLNQIALGLVITFALATAAQGDGFTPTGSLGTARYEHTATLVPSGKVLVVGGTDGSDLSSAELYNPATGTWSPTVSLPEGGRRAFTATLLPSGKVLVAGGAFGSPGYMGESSAADLYDPVAGTWMPTGSLNYNYSGHTATLLPNGKVLVVGDTAELYNPATGAWSATGSLANPRDSHTATLLPDGKVLVAGGVVNTYSVLASAELYDPATGSWSSTGNLDTGRYDHTATLLRNGKVLVAGGLATNSSWLASAELYDPATDTWSPAGGLSDARVFHTATLLPNGTVLVAGGNGPAGALNSAELSDPELSLLNPILNPVKLGDGSFQFGFNNPSGPSYRVLAGTDPAAPLNTWSNLGPATETLPGSGQFQFTDHQASNYPQRFYRVSSP